MLAYVILRNAKKNRRSQILINGQYHCDFLHRAPIMEADALQIQGDVVIQMVQFKV